MPAGRALIGLVDAFLLDDVDTRDAARQAVINEAGPEAFVDAAAVFANFEMMNRVAEGTGIPVPPQAIERESLMLKRLGLYENLDSKP